MNDVWLLERPFLRDLFVAPDLTLFTVVELATILGGIVSLAFAISFLNGRPHKLALLGLSALFIVLIDPLSGAVLLAYAGLSHYMLRHWGGHPGRMRLAAWSLIAILFTLKAVTTYWRPAGEIDFLILAGISYYTFRIAAILLDGARGSGRDDNLLDHLVYCLFFPIFVAGPIQRRQQFVRSDCDAVERLERAFIGLAGAIILKFLLADTVFFHLGQQCQSLAMQFERPALAFLVGFFGILRAFCDLQALTLLAISFGLLCGYQVPKNFNHPFIARSMADFWQRWHLTLTNWSKDYVFMPTFLITRRINLAILASFLFMGVWHVPTANWLMWGFGHAMGVIAHRYLKDWKALQTLVGALPEAGQMIYARIAWLATLVYVSIVFISVSSSDVATVLSLYGTLLGLTP